jgi:TonB family protein
MSITIDHLVAYSVQFAALAVTAAMVVGALRLRAPAPALRFWQAVAAISLALPFIQPATTSSTISLYTVTSIAGVAAAADTLSGSGIAIGDVLLYVVVGGASIRLLWLVCGVVRLRVITRRAERTEVFARLLHELTAALGAKATIALSDDIETPATVGVRRPLILVPRRLLELPREVQRAVIAHELIHVRRRDWLHTIAEQIWCAVLWFHPAANFIAARLSLARETVVDEAVIRLSRDRRAYAEALLAFANPQPSLPGVTALIRRRQLSQRISIIAGEEPMNCVRSTISVVVALLIAAAATSAAARAFPLATVSQPAVHEPGNGVTLPIVVHEVRPDYTPEALQAKVQGSVEMDVVVDAAGNVSAVTVTKSLDTVYGLDSQAVSAAYLWKFKPGTKDGTPVAVRVTLEMRFTLK